ncbi:tripartite tricarboxylate transporter TctB family protein [Alkalilacustris brevis]|uniref:tripartite tricarboxylate transporter TctB family protein n=1 Tax=Alkalilacustris brevis TaxID=2026338 RepID=UPI000E0CFAFC|nr:tripartite tricarboxylate transporter TctB family protein [Alkalilacustris brevis]
MNRTNVIAGVICFCIGALVYWYAGSVPAFTATDNLGGRFFPRLVASMLMLASAGLIITGLMNIEISGGTARKSSAPGAQSMAGEEAARDEQPRTPRIGAGEARLIGFILVMVIYTLILPLLGYIPASLLTFAALIWIAGEHRPTRVGLGSLFITGLLYLLFAVIFNMNLPEASLF